jgi:hypothetical protein
MERSGRIFNCSRCQAQVVVCSCCDRGQIYCGKECAQASRSESMKAAGARYQASRRGRINHAERQRRYREEQARQKIVTHHSSNEQEDHVLLSKQDEEVETEKLYCHFCRRSVSIYLRTGFLGSLGVERSIKSSICTRAP